MNSPRFDADGYPTDETLEVISKWPHEDFSGLMRFVERSWQYPNYFKQDKNCYSLSTGGWSGNEELIGALQANHMFWACCWESSQRGGHYTFRIQITVP